MYCGHLVPFTTSCKLAGKWLCNEAFLIKPSRRTSEDVLQNRWRHEASWGHVWCELPVNWYTTTWSIYRPENTKAELIPRPPWLGSRMRSCFSFRVFTWGSCSQCLLLSANLKWPLSNDVLLPISVIPFVFLKNKQCVSHSCEGHLLYGLQNKVRGLQVATDWEPCGDSDLTADAGRVWLDEVRFWFNALPKVSVCPNFRWSYKMLPLHSALLNCIKALCSFTLLLPINKKGR